MAAWQPVIMTSLTLSTQFPLFAEFFILIELLNDKLFSFVHSFSVSVEILRGDLSSLLHFFRLSLHEAQLVPLTSQIILLMEGLQGDQVRVCPLKRLPVTLLTVKVLVQRDLSLADEALFDGIRLQLGDR